MRRKLSPTVVSSKISVRLGRPCSRSGGMRRGAGSSRGTERRRRSPRRTRVPPPPGRRPSDDCPGVGRDALHEPRGPPRQCRCQSPASSTNSRSRGCASQVRTSAQYARSAASATGATATPWPTDAATVNGNQRHRLERDVASQSTAWRAGQAFRRERWLVGWQCACSSVARQCDGSACGRRARGAAIRPDGALGPPSSAASSAASACSTGNSARVRPATACPAGARRRAEVWSSRPRFAGTASPMPSPASTARRHPRRARSPRLPDADRRQRLDR